MKRVCAWCKKDMGIAASEHSTESSITHGICESCAGMIFAELSMEPAAMFLDGLSEPVLLVDGDVVALTANRKAREILAKDLPRIKGFKGGNIIECVHAHEPGGCGRTIHCTGCAIRNTVEETYKTGKSHVRVPAYADISVEGKAKKISLLITTERVQGVVLLRIDNLDDNNDN